MGETNKTAQDNLPKGGQPSGEKGGTTPSKTPELIPIEQVQKFVSDALAEQGRRHKVELDPIRTERDTLKSQIQHKADEITDVTAEREKLQSQIDDLTSDDPKKYDLVKRDRELREQERQLKADRRTLEDEKATQTETVKLAQDTLREVSIWTIAGDYETGDPVRLKDLCDTFEAKSEEQIRKVADNLWTKTAVEPEETPTPPLKIYSGMTAGGAINFDAMSPDEKIKYGLTHKKR